MRWPFRRRQTEPATPSIDASPVAAAPPAWASLPPLQRTVDCGAPLTAPPDGVLGDLVERWAPATVLAPLGHDAGGVGPAGTIGLTGAPIEAGHSGPELVGRPAPRATTIQRSASGPAWPSVPAEAPTAAPAALPPAPAPHLAPAVEPAAVSGPVAEQRSLTSAADPVGPVELTLPTVGAPALVQEQGNEQPPGPSTAIGTETPHGSAEQAPVQRSAFDAGQSTLTPPRRAGLGAPLSGGLPVQRSSPATLHERPKRVPVQRRSLDDLPVARTPARTIHDPDAPAGGEGSTAPTSSEPTAPPAVDTAPAAVFTGSIDVSRLAADGRPAPDPVRVLTRPIAGGLEPTVIQRSARDTDDPDAREASAEPFPGRDPAVPPLQRSASASLPERGTPAARIERLPSGTVELPPEPTLTVARSVAVDRPTPSGSLVVQSMTEPPAGRQVPSIVPIQRTVPAEAVPLVRWAPPMRSAPPPLTLAARPSETPAPAPRVLDVQRASEPILMAPAPVAAPSEPLANDGVADPANAVDTDAGLDIAIQRASDDAAGSAPTPAATSTPGGGQIAGASDKDLDELARRLYERIRRRLSRELLADRERAGLLTDLR